MTKDLIADLRAAIEAERRRFEVPGCAVVVVAAREVVLCEGFGTRALDGALPVTDRTLFPIASATKTFTAALCALLVESGQLAWDRPVHEYLPGFAIADPAASAQLTIYDMLCHRSGLPRHDLLWLAECGDMTRADLLGALAYLPLSRPFRETWQYNNLLFAAAGEIAAHLTGRSFEDSVRKLILDPLGMPRTNFSSDDLGSDEDAARGHAASRPGAPLREVPYLRNYVLGAAGNINSCVEELGHWLLTLLGAGIAGRTPLLSANALATLQAPAIPLPESSSPTIGRPVGYCLGARMEEYRGYRVVHHGGNIDGFSSMVSVVPEAGCAVAVLANRSSTALRDALPPIIYDRILGLSRQLHGSRLLMRETALLECAAKFAENATKAVTGLPPVRPLADYVGTYRHPAYRELVVSADGDGLAGRYRGLHGALEHRHLEVFNLVYDAAGRRQTMPVQFTHDLNGEVSAALCQFESAIPPMRFERVANDEHLTDEILDCVAGTYRRGPLIAAVSRRGERGLTARIIEGAARDLRLVRDLVFSWDDARIEFTRDGLMTTPFGQFTRDQ